VRCGGNWKRDYGDSYTGTQGETPDTAKEPPTDYRASSRPYRATGKTGKAGKLSRADRQELLSLVHGQISEVSHELTAQMKRMQSLKNELAELRTNMARVIHGSDRRHHRGNLWRWSKFSRMTIGRPMAWRVPDRVSPVRVVIRRARRRCRKDSEADPSETTPEKTGA